MEPLHATEIAERLGSHPEWELLHGERIRREVQLGSFVEAFGAMTRIAFWAEKLNHHPEWSNVYDRITIELTTHDAAGLTDLDFELASHVDAIVAACVDH